MQKVKNYRWAPALGEFENSPDKIWGVKKYTPESLEPCVFCGLYGLPDFFHMWRYKGKKYIWWTGSDIRHFMAGYWLDQTGKIRVEPKPLAEWISKNCESWVENEVEAKALKKFGIKSHVCPSFLGRFKHFKVTYKWQKRPQVFASVSGDDFKLYGWDKIEVLAKKNPQIDFHLYGNTVKAPFKFGKNVTVHGRVPKEVFNEETKKMQGGLRLVPFDGFSEVIAKSVLRGQYPISTIKYKHCLQPDQIGRLTKLKRPNLAGRNYYLKKLNKYPWAK